MERHLVQPRYEYTLSPLSGVTDTPLHGYTISPSAARQICEAHASTGLDWLQPGERLWAAYSAAHGYYLIFTPPDVNSDGCA